MLLITPLELPSAPDRNDVKKRLQQYYREIGWDENGVPKYETLKEQGLEDVGKALKKLSSYHASNKKDQVHNEGSVHQK